MQKESEISPASLSRSRSNSHSGKKEPKSGESVVIQDSGFSTETSSSKEAHSASSTTTATTTISSRLIGGGGGNVSAMTLVAGDHHPSNELWNLLDVIHRKSTRLRDEVDQITQRSMLGNNSTTTTTTSGGSSSSCSNCSEQPIGSGSGGSADVLRLNFQKQLTRLSKDDVQILRKERDRLLAQLSDMESETVAGRLKMASMQHEISGLSVGKQELEEKLKAALSQTLELNNGIRDLHKQHVQSVRRRSGGVSRRRSSEDMDEEALHEHRHPHQTNVVVVNGDRNRHILCSSNSNSSNCDEIKTAKNELNVSLGRLDGVVSTPNRLHKVRLVDSKKIASILMETNYVELQRHLLTLTVQNQVSKAMGMG